MRLTGPFWVDASDDYERAFVVGKDGRIMCSVLGDFQTLEEKKEHARRIAAALNRDEARKAEQRVKHDRGCADHVGGPCTCSKRRPTKGARKR